MATLQCPQVPRISAGKELDHVGLDDGEADEPHGELSVRFLSPRAREEADARFQPVFQRPDSPATGELRCASRAAGWGTNVPSAERPEVSVLRATRQSVGSQTFAGTSGNS